MEKKWSDLNIKDKLAIISALVAFTVGWGLTIAAFIVDPMGEIHDSVLFILGQALIYAASVFGVASYFSSETIRLRHDLKNFVNQKVREYEENSPNNNISD